VDVVRLTDALLTDMQPRLRERSLEASVQAGDPAPAWADRRARLARYREWRTTWEPGTRFEYHATSAHWVLADCITEVTGRPFADVVFDKVMEPAGLGPWLGVAETDQADVVDVVSVGGGSARSVRSVHRDASEIRRRSRPGDAARCVAAWGRDGPRGGDAGVVAAGLAGGVEQALLEVDADRDER